MPSRLSRHDEPNHIHYVTFCCFRRLQFFRNDCVCRSLIDAMRNVRGKLGIRWLGYVIMPEHVHLLLLPQAGEELVPISTVLNQLKGWSGRLGKESLRSVWREKQSLGAPPLDAWATGPEPKPFWKTRGYDFNVLKEDTFLEKLDYMHKNPVRRNLVDGAADWRWSSYRFYECGDASLIDMDSLPG